MRSLRIRQGVREARQVFTEANRLVMRDLPATLELGLPLSLLPALILAMLVCSRQSQLLSLWENFVDTTVTGAKPAQGLFALTLTTLQQSGQIGFAATLLELLSYLLLTPLLLSSLAFLYNGFVRTVSQRRSIASARMAGKNARKLVLVSLFCMIAQWIAQMIPSIASGVLSAVAGLLSFIPFIGSVASLLSVILSALVSILTDFAITVVFCYVWISASCESIPGFSALVRSWQLTRNALHETIFALLGMVALKWIAIAFVALLWLLPLRALGFPLRVMICCAYGVNAVFSVYMGAITSALYQHRLISRGPNPGQFQNASVGY